MLQWDALHLPLRDDFADAVVTDPPAGIAFMGKRWDHDKGGRRQWVDWMTQAAAEALRVCKPGAHGFFWSLPRTSHWTAWALEEAGWEIRDSVLHLFGSGFPKSADASKAIDRMLGANREVVGTGKGKGGENLNLLSRPGKLDSPNAKGCGAYGFGAKQVDIEIPITAPATEEARRWDGYGTALKPAYEQWHLARKPLGESSVAANLLRWGTGAINIDASRVPGADTRSLASPTALGLINDDGWRPKPVMAGSTKGRWPSNVLLTHSTCEPGGICADDCPAAIIDRQSGTLTSGLMKAGTKRKGCYGGSGPGNTVSHDTPGDTGGASRFFRCFYQAKPSSAERKGVNHPTVKPLGLMEYLIRLICPVGGVVVDPFAGSFTTLEAALRTGRRCVAGDLEAEHLEDGAKRMAAVQRGLF